MNESPLRDQLAQRLKGRVVVIGIGNPLCGDDGAGCEVARHLRQLAIEARALSLTVVDAEEVPESYVGPVVAADPDAVLLVDAVDLGAEPGSVALLEHEALGEAPVLTHRTPLKVLASYLAHEANTHVYLLAIQPARVAWGAPLSPSVATAAHHAALVLLQALQQAHVNGTGAPGAEATA